MCSIEPKRLQDPTTLRFKVATLHNRLLFERFLQQTYLQRLLNARKDILTARQLELKVEELV